MYILTLCIIVSSFSFLAYAFSYFNVPHMKNEFKRFGIEKLGLLIILLEIMGALGLVAGLLYNWLLMLSSLGLALLMFIGLLVRLKLKDSLRVSLPALFYMLLNAYIFWISLGLQN